MTTIRVEHEPIETTPTEEPESDWMQPCTGHEHKWIDGEVSGVRRVIVAEATEEYPEVVELVCIGTGETITPRWRSPAFRSYVPGPRHFYIDDVECTEQELLDASKRIEAAL